MLPIDNFLDHHPPLIKNNVKVVTPDELGQSFFLHISNKDSRYYYPRVSTKQIQGEDRSIPRVTVSDSLTGSIIGYAKIEEDFLRASDSLKNTSNLDITKIDFEYALRPNSKLVPDVNYSNEHWLVTYSKDTVRYTPKKIGSMFVSEINYSRSDKGFLFTVVKVLIELKTNDIIRLDKVPGNTVSKGYYSFNVNLYNETISDLKTIDKKTFYSTKSDVLSMESNSPLYSEW